MIEIEKRLTMLEDLELIKKLHQKYISHIDNLEFEKILNLFTDDATFEKRDSGVRKGKKEISKLLLEMAAVRKNIKEGHLVIQPDIHIDGDKATGTWMVFILFWHPSVQWVQGRNECEYVKEKGKWKYRKLKFTRINASQPHLFP